MKAKRTIRNVVVWMLLISILLLGTIVFVQVMEIPIWIEHYEGYSIVHYVRLHWVENLCPAV